MKIRDAVIVFYEELPNFVGSGLAEVERPIEELDLLYLIYKKVSELSLDVLSIKDAKSLFH